jgi:hypothetical protein
MAALLGGCSDVSSFSYGLSLDPCDGNVPTACTLSASCVLDGSHYIAGSFPSARRFVVRSAGDQTVNVAILLTDERAPGTQLVFTIHEPACGDRTTWDTGGRRLFDLTDSSGILVVPLHVSQAGDHLVEFFSDAYCGYAMKIGS